MRSAQPSQNLFFLLGSPGDVSSRGPGLHLCSLMEIWGSTWLCPSHHSGFCLGNIVIQWQRGYGRRWRLYRRKRKPCLSLFSVKALNHTRLLRGNQFESCSNVSKSEAWASDLPLDGVKFRFAVPRTTFEACNVDLGPHLALHPLEKNTHQVNKQVGETVCGGWREEYFSLWGNVFPWILEGRSPPAMRESYLLWCLSWVPF